jgi:AbrB family looped-hinge helix DNA binding protein
MSVVRILKHGQVTIPKKFRETLGLERGDLVEAELHGDQVVITPKTLVKEKTLQELKALLQRVHARNQGFTEEEVAADVQRAIAELREEDYAKQHQSESGS